MPAFQGTVGAVQGTREHLRLAEPFQGALAPWRKWGTYVGERSWATVREDYSANGDAWRFLTHDMARSKAYRWGEDAIAGWCDRYQLLVFAPAFWNRRDPILKERLFGLDPSEGNHGEDVKECYYYLDALPTHAYAKFLYKYPQAEFPYAELVARNRQRSAAEPEWELTESGVFEQGYFDIFVEYAKVDAEDVFIYIEAFNRGSAAAELDVLGQLWFRNTWAWGERRKPQPSIAAGPAVTGAVSLVADDSNAEPLHNLTFEYRLGERWLYATEGAELLFTDNETNTARVSGPGSPETNRWSKDAFHRHIIGGEPCVNPDRRGTKAALRYRRAIPAGGSARLVFRLSNKVLQDPLAGADEVLAQRRAEADEFYAAIHPAGASAELQKIQRQALAGLVWSKQIYLFNVHQWIEGDNPAAPPPEGRRRLRNVHWKHLNSMRILSMPDKWEYPWFAAWDLAFQAIPFALIDPEFAKEQLWLLLFEQFQHPNGQIPAYEWEFSDVNPPVHAWAVWRVYNMDRIQSGKGDRLFLEKCFHKLLINFAWWVNKVDSEGNNVFEGGFLGLDNITVLDRSVKLPPGVRLEQADATGWMGMFCLNMMRIALELAKEDSAYESLATKFFEHYVYIAAAMKNMGNRGYQLWDEKDGFFYDVLRYADGSFHKLRVRSLVGLVPLFAVERLEEDWMQLFPVFRSNIQWFVKNRRSLIEQCVTTVQHSGKTIHVLAIINPEQMRQLLQRVWDEAEFRSPFGLRSLSKAHAGEPFRLGENEIRYEPAEATVKIKGGNSNWRGPVWFPTTFLMVEAMAKLQKSYGKDFVLTGSGWSALTPEDVARGLAQSMFRLFLPNEAGRRPIHGNDPRYATDPHWRDLLLFHEYFDGETGKGLGASHQTGWTALIANLIAEWS